MGSRSHLSSQIVRVLVVTAVAAVVAGGCGIDRPRAVIVGDSLTADATAQIDDAVPGAVDIDGVPGATIDARLGRIRDIARRDPEVVVVALGTNDGFFGAPDPGRSAARVLDALAEAGCVRWIGVATVIDEPALVNVPIAEAVAEHDNAEFVDWTDAAAEHPEWFQPDGIHHSEPGRAAFADVVADAVADCRREV